MGVTGNNLVELTATDNTNDEIVVYDDSASRLKKISPDNLRDSLLTGSALVTCDDTTLTASRAVLTDGSGQLAAATTTTSELQALNSLTASRAMVTDGSGLTTVSSTTATELGYVNGVTSAIQTQIDATKKFNMVYNSNFDLWNSGTPFASISDETYTADGWWYLDGSSNTITVSQGSSSPPTGSQYYLQIEKTAGAGTQECGIILVLEAAEAVPLQGKAVSVSCQVKKASGGTNPTLGIGMYSWTGTADAATNDIVSTWPNGASIPPSTGMATSWTYEGGSSVVLTDSSWTSLTSENISLDTSSINNICIYIGYYYSGTDNHSIQISQAQLVVDDKVPNYEIPSIALEQTRAQRRFFRITGDASNNGPRIYGWAGAGASELRGPWISFPTTMRTTPTTAVGGTWFTSNCTGPTIASAVPEGAWVYASSSASGEVICYTNSTDDYLEFKAEPTANQP